MWSWLMERLSLMPTIIKQERSSVQYFFWKETTWKGTAVFYNSCRKAHILSGTSTHKWLWTCMIPSYASQDNSTLWENVIEKILLRTKEWEEEITGEHKWAFHKQQQKEHLPERTELRTPKLLVTTAMWEDINLGVVHQHKRAPMVSPAYKSVHIPPSVYHKQKTLLIPTGSYYIQPPRRKPSRTRCYCQTPGTEPNMKRCWSTPMAEIRFFTNKET